jgi:hypothetical protein
MELLPKLETVPTSCSTPSIFKNVSQTEKKLGTTGQISANTQFTNVIMKFQEKINARTGSSEPYPWLMV